MNKITRRFLSGASFLALSLGMPTSIARAGITVNTAAHGPVTVAPFSVTDFVWVTGGGIVNGDILNEGFILNTAGETFAIEVGPGGSVTGNIINERFILAHQYGIVDIGNVGGNISNTASGLINVVNSNLAGSSIAGIAVLNAGLGGIVNNSGSMNVIATGATGAAIGIELTSTSDLFITAHNGGSVLVIDGYKSAGANISVNVAGMSAVAGSDMGVHLTNAGKITATAVGGGKTVFASAVGISASNLGNTDGSSNNFAEITNAGSLKVVAAASGVSKATAQAAGIWEVVDGGGGANAQANFSNTASGQITVTANANGSGAGFASAFGVNEVAVNAWNSAKASAINNGDLHVLASASGTNATAVAVGFQQFAAVGSDGTAAAFVRNGGDVSIIANADGSGIAQATGVFQIARGISAGSQASIAHATFDNSGDFFVSANGFGAVAQATALGVFQSAVSATGVGSANVYNAGAFTVIAKAVGVADANAKATGLIQTVDPATGTAQFTNTTAASFKVTATAQAKTNATATAKGIGQFVTASVIANAYVFNSGLIDITAQAIASDATPAATAAANAFVNYGIQQSALSADTVKAQISNFASATIDIGAHAFASAAWAATANAKVTAGIKQVADTGGAGGSGSDAHVTLQNLGDIGIVAKATAEASWASANATIVAGISQFASAQWTATAQISNGGAIGITAQAIAHGVSSGDAFAKVSYGIAQQAVTTNGSGVNVTLSNSGNIDIKALATATGGFSAVATALIVNGISQAATGSWDAQVSLYNSGDINILAHAQVTANSAYDVAKISSGFYQRASGSGFSTVLVTLSNAASGNITVQASAIAKGQNQASAWGTLNYGIAQHATSADRAIANLSNQGDIHLTAFAHATATSGSAHAYADMVFGVWQSANADGDTGAQATAELVNSGMLGVVVSAKATGTASVLAHAQLSDWGIYQLATDAGSANVTLDNSGDFTIAAHAYAKGDALATAIIGTLGAGNATAGILQYADGSNFASVSLNNHSGGKIGVIAQATAIDTQGGPATANAWIEGAGIRQIATSADQAAVNFHNTSGTIAIQAIALASATAGAADVSVFIQTGIYQRAASTGTGVTFAKDVLTNDGTLDIIAQATAKGGSAATASAYINYGISQGAFGGDTASASLENNGQLNIWALAKATADNANANASITGRGIFQHAFAGDDSLVASVKLTNGASGTIQILDRATANGETHAFAHADLHSGIVQYASGAESVAAFLSNAGGNIFITAKAHASATTGDASAYAFMVAGVFQHASGSGTTSSTAVASLINSGNIGVHVNATANASSNASALAHATLGGWGIYQQATNAANVHAGLNNSGDIEIVAHAHAQGSNATALAQIGVTPAAAGIFQSASALNSASTASVDLTNLAGGTIGIVAQATAVSESLNGANVKASALINDYGIHQVAGGAGDESIKLDNSGLINIVADANAHATWTGGGASAHAFLHEGISQHAVVSGGGSGDISLTNADGGKINIIASAHAQGSDNNGKAVATVSYGISQYAQFAGSAALKIDNSGTVVIAAIANVDGGWNSSGFASAGIAAGIDQSASASFGGQTKAVAALTNAGKITIEAFAHATGDTNASAIAAIGQGIIQFAHGADSASVTLKNTGTLNIEALAHASGDALASAQINYGIEQIAYAGNNQSAATVQITNGPSGIINIIAAATATGGVATANATISNYGIYQYAYSASVAKALITNAGDINIMANALANASTGAAQAFAIIGTSTNSNGTGINQLASATISGATAEALIANTGKIAIEANATALGATAATASAYMQWGIRQYATAYGGHVSVELTGAGTLDIIANALATATSGAAKAFAAIHSGIDQDASDSGAVFHTSALASISVGGGAIEAIAIATGSAASAKAYIEQHGIFQSASQADTDKVSFVNNSGDFVIGAIAHADATVGKAYAYGSINYGIYQHAQAGNSELLASAVITNTGKIAIEALATANGVTIATATAKVLHGISQQALGGGIAHAELIGSGDVTILAQALASATSGPAKASASIITGIHQLAKASAGGSTSALASIAIGGGSIAAIAKAAGVSGALAIAEVSYGIGQFAYGGTNAKAFFSNTGDFNIVAAAKANVDAGNASAYAYMVYGVFQFASANGTTGSKATASLINSGDLSVMVAASAIGSLLTGAAYAQATLGGWGIYQQATNAEDVHAVLSNTGDITIAAHALARASNATAYAKIGVSTAASGTAIFQSASALNNDFTASVSLINGSLAAINIIAQATAVTSSDGPAVAGAFIYNTGIVQVAGGAGIENILLDNQGGTIAIVADANAHAQWSGNGTANAYIGGGIHQHAVASSGTASITLNNAAGGNIVVRASASATGWSNAKASATVGFGISQVADFAATANLAIVNTGDISVAAIAKASASNGAGGTAIANIGTGIFQSANVTGASANLLINNSGKILIEAAATASGSTGPQASASVDHGISQHALNGGIVSAKLTGAGTVSVIAHAKASASFSQTASAFATIGTGILQTANAATSGTSALASIDIGGGAIVAIASARGTQAKASATISNYGINQQATQADTAKALLENSGSFNIAALAKAVGTQGSAIAHATIDTGINQDAWANASTGNVATASLLNSGTLNIVASAFASGPDGATASAKISNAGISQQAWQGDTVNAVIHNSGSLNIAAIAKAVASRSGTIVGAALAKATIATGLHQDAWANSNTSNFAGVSLTVGKALNIVASAFASGASGAKASATISNYGLSQAAWQGDTVKVLLDNSGTLNIAALAHAVGGSGNALAHATIDSGLHQEAWANSASGNAATVSLLNGGTLNIVASAFASGAGGATASASINEIGLSQQAWQGASEKVVLHDSGSLNIAALAKAVAGSGAALAKATIQTGLHQEAWANNSSGNVATVSVTVGTALNIVASAFASGASGATASATIAKFGISQSAWDAATAKALLSNSGSLNIAVLAKAVAGSGSALANATLQKGLHQEAWANGTTGNVATVSIVNGGTLNIVAAATASGSSVAKALASIAGYGISQTAHDGDVAKAILKNSGEINIAALAHADGDVTATAFINTGIKQTVAAAVTALASLTNAGTINIVAKATAIGTPAYAIATLNYGILQSALGGTYAKAFLSSTGPLNIAALAKASAPNATFGSSAGAYAYMVYGIFQYASANGAGDSFATASLINSGDIAIVVSASAIARGFSGNAYARATLNNWGIYQQATNAEDVSAVLDNSGDISIAALAHAVGGGSGNANATALAQIGTVGAPSAVGIFQSASALNNDFTASVSLLNGTGAINIVAQAVASTTSGTGTALAQAFIYNTGILQVAQGAGIESIKLDNEGGTIAIAAIASANVWSGAGTATAFVGGGIYQHAVASSGTASIDLTNAGGNIVIVADADAAGWSANANAKATLTFGIGQLAQFAATATLAIANSGSITIAALAHAHYNPSTAKAVANIATGIFQSASVTGASANLVINNSGKILIEAAATAEDAFWNATATATIGVGINQKALDGSNVSAKLTGAGTVDIVAQAVATADLSGASAFATIVTGIYQNADAVTGGTSALASISIGGGGIVAHALADGSQALAEATIQNYGIYQQAIARSAAEDDFINASGAFTIGAIATATATVLGAVAHATIANGIYQFASATGSTFRASASIWNAGTLAILADANAHGATQAIASAYNYNAVYQSALGGKQAIAGFYNSGNMLIGAIAHADASAGPAKAYAYMSTGVYQFASAAGGAGNVATAVLSNSGNFTIIASAKATGTGTVTATATITSYGIYQNAHNGDTVKALLHNSGSLSIAALAYANGDALANANIQTGIYQTAYAVGNQVAATASITNGGTLAIVAQATAIAAGPATANAAISSYGIYQHAHSADTAKAFIGNSGTLDILAAAKATATTGTAVAHASIGHTGGFWGGIYGAGIYQSAQASNNSVNAIAAITNGGVIDIVAAATAVASTGNATASASIALYGIYQHAYSADVAKASIQNGGTLLIAADAKATALSGAAVANATVGNSSAWWGTSGAGIYQSAVAANNQVSAEALIDNSGKLVIEAAATAHGATSAQASAYVLWGISQFANSAANAKAELTGAGTVVIAALASATAASGFASGYAKIDTGIYQSAKANAGARTSAVAAIDVANLAIIASAYGQGADASAYAYINTTGIYQLATSGDVADVSLKNSGDLNIAAIAKAVGSVTSATAYAYIDHGIYQSAQAADDRVSAVAAITNSGTMAIIASAFASGVKNASATAYNYYGIEQYAEGAPIGSVLLNGGGVVDIAAIASAKAASGFASGYAYMSTGIYQYATANYGAQSRAVASISLNGGAIMALANAKGTSATAYGYIESYGVYQYVNYGDQALISLKNTGSFDIAVLADATATVKNAYAYAYLDYGIYQVANASDDRLTALASISDIGDMAIVASAKAVGVTAATAYAYNSYGIEQQAYGAAIGSALLKGGGDLNIAAVASASATGGFAYGYGRMYTGIYQYATALYNSQTLAKASIALGDVAIVVAANAKGTSATAYAYLSSYGVEQYAYYGDQALVSLKNDGTFNIAALANATATVNNAFAYAYMDYGIYQYAYAGGDQLTATAAIHNSGDMNIIASAHAVGATRADATAYLYYGIEQYAYNAGKGNAVIDGGAALNIAAIASASATGGFASGYAFMYTGIYQSATATAGFTSANALIDVDGGGVLAVANAKGTSAYAYGSISAYGIYQYATGGDEVSAKLLNSGVFDVAAIANATGTAKNASAFAYLYTGIYQYASAGNNELTAIASISNSGTLAVIASAHAVGGTNAVATASITNYGIYQSAIGAGIAQAKIVGNGIVDVAAIANATAASGPAAAYAFLSTGIYQYPNAGGNSNTSGVASISVSGGGVMAIANAKGSTANATASITNYGIYQYVSGADYVAANFKNTGGFNIAAIANATASVGFAFATATISSAGIYQYVYAGDDKLTAVANFTNSGTMAVIASAHAKGVTGASAIGYLDYGISQYVASGHDAGANLVNNGDLMVGAGAVASATGATGNAFASALLVTGIYQYVYGTAGSGAAAHASLTNTGQLIVFAQASAKGAASQTVSALASISAYGIYQNAYYGDTAKVAIQNSGTLAIEAIAHASGDAFASAYIGTGIYQQAYATNNYVAATAAIGNTSLGVINIAAIATAVAALGSATASAYLSGYGIYQHAYSADEALASIDNAGALAIIVAANATAKTAAAHAYAIIGTTNFNSGTGIYQSASVTGNQISAQALIDNSGSIDIVAQAVANGATAANATAYVLWGISQYAFNGATDSAKLVGGGNVNIAAIASANATAGFATAYASIITGIYQSATASEYALASIDVGGGAVAAIANAKGTGATASAFIQTYGVYQYASASSATAVVNFKNSGIFNIAAAANATATQGAAYALASIAAGIYQYAYASSGFGSANLTNSGTMGVVASARAHGVTAATATGHITYGITQYVYSVESGIAHLQNDGILNVAAIAVASATSGPAIAHASLTTGIYQYVSAWEGNHTEAQAYITNSGGTLAVIAQANAKGQSATATATINSYGIYQYAAYGDSDFVGLQNSGVLDVAAIANATGTTGAAHAYASLTYGMYQYAYASYAELTASVTLANNGGTLAVIASANASGQTAANATAYAYYGIVQYANDAGLANATIENSGELDVVARANAVAANGPAFAYAFMYTGIYQSATAYYGSHTNAFVSLSDAGTLAIMAAAQATGDTATATASISNYGLYQYANYGDADTASLFNSGTLEVAAIAGAVAAKTANAFAHVATGIYQFASASYASNTAAVNLTNATSGKVEVFAFASASGNPANATASIGTGILQSAIGADGVFAFIDNDGTMNVAAIANAKGDVTANAFMVNGVVQLASNTINHPTAQATLLNGGKMFVTVAASAVDTGNGSANALASIAFHGVYQQAYNGATDSAVLENSGTLGVNAIAKADGDIANASALINGAGVAQIANGVTGGSALASLTNATSAQLVVAAIASANGGGSGNANAFVNRGISQQVSGVDTGTAFLSNAGLIEAAASADAAGGLAVANASVVALSQNVVVSSAAFATLLNAGTFIVMAAATALGGASGSAKAFASGGRQFVSASNTAFASFVNSGTFEAVAGASAAGNNAIALAGAFGPLQSANAAGLAGATFLNGNIFMAQAKATAVGGVFGSVYASASGVLQHAVGGGTAIAVVENDAIFAVGAVAKATGDLAIAYANGRGVLQGVTNTAGNATAVFTNSDVFSVHATASALGGASGSALATAVGLEQFLAGGGNEVLHNAGTFIVEANAFASGSNAEAATALAVGAVIAAGSSAAVSLDILNTGIFYVLASANDAIATAIGIEVNAAPFLNVAFSGTIENDNLIQVVAKAPGGSALAIGVAVVADQFTGNIINTGTLYALALGATARATGIRITNVSTTGATGTGTIDNDGGTIWAGITNNGSVILRGTAIDVSGAPNAIVINLEGNTEDGVVFGNIKLSPQNDDTINVINGKTIFDGGINPDGDLFGTLNVGGGTAPGTMEFVHNPIEGQAYAYVDTYNQFADGTIFFHVDANPDPDFVFIHANDATLDGTIQLDFAPGLYADTTVWRIVLATNPISGEWDQVVSNFQSLFLTPVALYTTFEADIVLNRAPFTDFCQDSKNNKSFTQGLENGYSPNLTGAFKDLVQAILFLHTEDEFCDVVDQLKGEEIGETAFANLESAEILKDAVSAHLQAIWGGPEQMTEMRNSISPASGGGRVSIWGGAYGKWGSLDRTDSGPGFDSSENGLVAGADVRVGQNTLLGVAGSWTSNGDLNFDNRNNASFDGYQVGVYGRHNAGQLYLQGLAAFGSYSDDTRRFISIPNFGSGSTKGSFNNDVWQIYGEGGYHISTSGRVDLVPYAALHYLHGDADSFTEHGFPGVNLHVSSAEATSFSSYLGMRLALLGSEVSDGTSIVPTIKVAWQHEFEDTLWSVNAAFEGVPATAFKTTGEGFARDSLVAGGELAISWGSNVDAVIDYEGRFNGDRTSNAVIGRLNFRL